MSDEARKPAQRGVQSIEVGGRVLAAFVKSAGPMMLRDLAIAADLAPAQVHGYLASFRRIGLVEQDLETGRYRLGAFAMRLGMARLRSVPCLFKASEGLAGLAGGLGLMVVIVVWGPHGPTVVQVQEGPRPLDLNIRQGTRFRVTATASGAVFAAYSVRREVQHAISRERREAGLPEQAEARSSSFHETIGEVRALGYSRISDTPVLGINAVSAPLFEGNGDLAAAITLIGRKAELALEPGDRPATSLLRFTSAISGLAPHDPVCVASLVG